MSEARDRELSEKVERELAALADGSLTGDRREQASERMEGSPRLRRELADQQRALQLLAAADVEAPSSLHERIGAMAATATQAPPSTVSSAWRRRMRSLRRPRLAIGFAATTLLAGVVGIALALSGGGGHEAPRHGEPALSASSAARLALGAATLPAPAESHNDHNQLAAAVGGVSFPYWRERFGWRGSGARSDTLAGRAVTTVFYSNSAGRRIGYAIVAGPAPATAGGSVLRRWGVSYRLSSQDGANVIAWRRDGHLCVIAGRGVSASTLLALASWGGERRRAA